MLAKENIKTKKTKGFIIKEVLIDPGVDYNIGAMILFAAYINVIGFAACSIALGVSIVSKVLAISDTDFAKKHPKFSKILLDPKTPLLTNAAALATISVVALINGTWLPAAASFLWAVGDIRIAQSIEKANHDKEKKTSPSCENKEKQEQTQLKRTLSLIFKRGDIYINGAACLSGLLAGGWAVLAIPILTIATIISLKNAIQNKPEYAGHPKIISAFAKNITTTVGIINGNWLPAIAFAIFAGIFVNVECKITPGGGRQILRDIKGGFTHILNRKKPKQAPSHSPVLVQLSQK